VVYVGAPSVSLYMQHIKRFAGDHVASKNLLNDGPVPKSRGHFKAAYSAEALCWICGSANHDPRQCKMLTSALADYRSKHLHKGSSRGGGGFRNNNSRGRLSGRGGFTSRNNARGGHHGDNNARGALPAPSEAFPARVEACAHRTHKRAPTVAGPPKSQTLSIEVSGS
jgi:hypothetical protein